MRKAYDSDVSREQFNQISRDLEFLKKKTRPREVDLYDVFCAILYLLKNACSWRNLPHGFPNWKLVNYYYGIWTKKDETGEPILNHILAKEALINQYFLSFKTNPRRDFYGEGKTVCSNSFREQCRIYDSVFIISTSVLYVSKSCFSFTCSIFYCPILCGAGGFVFICHD